MRRVLLQTAAVTAMTLLLGVGWSAARRFAGMGTPVGWQSLVAPFAFLALGAAVAFLIAGVKRPSLVAICSVLVVALILAVELGLLVALTMAIGALSPRWLGLFAVASFRIGIWSYYGLAGAFIQAIIVVSVVNLVAIGLRRRVPTPSAATTAQDASI